MNEISAFTERHVFYKYLSWRWPTWIETCYFNEYRNLLVLTVIIHTVIVLKQKLAAHRQACSKGVGVRQTPYVSAEMTCWSVPNMYCDNSVQVGRFHENSGIYQLECPIYDNKWNMAFTHTWMWS